MPVLWVGLKKTTNFETQGHLNLVFPVMQSRQLTSKLYLLCLDHENTYRTPFICSTCFAHHHRYHNYLSCQLCFPSLLSSNALSSHRDSFKRLSFRRTQEENSWDATACLTERERKSYREEGESVTQLWKETRREDERAQNKEGNCWWNPCTSLRWSSTMCPQWQTEFLSSPAVLIDVCCLSTFMISWLFVMGSKADWAYR